MTGTSQPGADGPNYLPPEVMEIVWPALQVGGLSGMSTSLDIIPISSKRFVLPLCDL